MSDVFISYARSTEGEATKVADALRALGYGVWRDDELPAHRAYAEVIEERLKAAKAVVVIWSAEAAKSQWVRSEADRAREDGKLVQLSVDGARPPMPFDTIQCANLAGWSGDPNAPGWRKVAASIAELVERSFGGATKPGEDALPLPSKPSVAVMPFANLSGDAEQEYFADGMVEEIAAALSRFKSLFVIGSGSSLSFKGKAASTQEVGRHLGIRYVLEGSVRKAGNRVRIAVKLTHAGDGAQIWADRFEDTLEDVFALQDKVALSVAGVIEPTLPGSRNPPGVAWRPTENMGSYDVYLRAQAAWTAGTLPDLVSALELMNRAIALEPGFGPALGAAATLHSVLSLAHVSGDPAAHREASAALIQRALQAAGDDAAVLVLVARASVILGRDAAAAAAMIDRALALNPGSAEAWSVSGRLRLAMGEADLAARHIETATRLDPLSSSRFEELADLGCARLLQHRFVEAIVLFNQSIELRPGFAPSHAWLAGSPRPRGRKLAEARGRWLRFRGFGFGTVEDFADRRFRTPASRKLFLDGVAMAEGTNPSAATS